jgi:hypothetical protein
MFLADAGHGVGEKKQELSGTSSAVGIQQPEGDHRCDKEKPKRNEKKVGLLLLLPAISHRQHKSDYQRRKEETGGQD